MSMHVTITIKGTEEEIQRLQSLGDKLFRMPEAMKSIGEDLKAYFSGEAFASQGDVLGHLWPDLKPSYAVWKAKHYASPILVGKNDPHMRDRFTYEATDTGVTISNPTPYFPFIQLGTYKMPARPMMGINAHVRSIVQDAIQSDVDQKLASF